MYTSRAEILQFEREAQNHPGERIAIQREEMAVCADSHQACSHAGRRYLRGFWIVPMGGHKSALVRSTGEF
jgi:hypothetical protein